MNHRQRIQLSSAQITYDYLNEAPNAPVWQPVEAFADGVDRAGGSLNILKVLRAIQDGKTEGLTLDKDRLQRSLITRMVRVGNLLEGMGNVEKNGDLAANARVSRHSLSTLPDEDLDDRGQALYDLAVATRAADPAKAARYGLKTGAADKLLPPLLSAVTAYSLVVNNPRKAINRRADATESIDAELHRLLAIYDDELDKLIGQFEEDHDDFVKGYGRARQQVETGGGSGGNEGEATPKV